MFGQGKELTAASDRFAKALPITPERIADVEAILSAIDDEIEQGQRQIAQFRERDPNPGETEIAIASRQGAELALTAERSRWRKILNVLREVPPRPIDPTGHAYIVSSNPPIDPR